jgi:hypothetical protein
MKTKDPIDKIRRLALKKGTPLTSFSRTGRAVLFLYRVGTRLKGFSYSNMEKAIPAELKRLAA